MEPPRLNVKKFHLKELGLNYSIGMNRVKVKPDSIHLDDLMELIDMLEARHDGAVIQFFNPHLLLSEEHLYIASYHALKGFKTGINISNNEHIELFLYLAANRQISASIEAFGVKRGDLKRAELCYCIISEDSSIQSINEEILESLQALPIEMDFKETTLEKIKQVMRFFEISKDQLRSVYASQGINPTQAKEANSDPKSMVGALIDIICEKMALLSLENA